VTRVLRRINEIRAVIDRAYSAPVTPFGFGALLNAHQGSRIAPVGETEPAECAGLESVDRTWREFGEQNGFGYTDHGGYRPGFRIGSVDAPDVIPGCFTADIRNLREQFAGLAVRELFTQAGMFSHKSFH
jgi:hypothetical protein